MIPQPQLDWIAHSLVGTADVLAMDLNVSERIYGRDHLAALRIFHHDKQAVYAALRTGQPIPAALQPVAEFLIAYADAHLMLWGNDPARFRVTMDQARHKFNTRYGLAERMVS